MQNYDFSLIIRKFPQRTSQILLPGIVPVRRTKPYRVDIERHMSISNLGVVKNGVAHTRKEIGFLVYRLAYTSVLDRLQKHLVNRVLAATPVTRNRRREQQQCRPMLPIQGLDLGGISFRPAHFAVSMLRQSAPMDLSMSAELLCWAALNPGKVALRLASLDL